MYSIPDAKKAMIQNALQAIAGSLGIAQLPACICKAKPEIFDGLSLEISSFLIFYADRWEQGKVENKAEVFEEWLDLTDSYLERDYLYRLVTNVFNHQVLAPNPVICVKKRWGGIMNRMKNGLNPIGGRPSAQGIYFETLPACG